MSKRNKIPIRKAKGETQWVRKYGAKKDSGGLGNMRFPINYAEFPAPMALSGASSDSGADSESKFLSVLATNIWRMQQKMLDTESGEAKDEFRRVYRYVEAIFDALTRYGVETKDHTKQKYDDGLGLKVITSESRPDLKHPEIIETLKPTVRYKGKSLQIGEVVVGTPE